MPAELIPLPAANDPYTVPRLVPRLPRAEPAPIASVEGADTVDASADEDGLASPASPTSIPPGTMINSKTMVTSAFLERMTCVKGDRCDEGLSERSDKSIYDENVSFTSS